MCFKNLNAVNAGLYLVHTGHTLSRGGHHTSREEYGQKVCGLSCEYLMMWLS